VITQKKTNSWLKKIWGFVVAGAFSAFVGNTTAYIFAAPILLWWGMPQSTMSIVGNVIFAPFLSVFILLCSLMLGTALFGGIPTILSAPLEYVTTLWMKCLSLGTTSFLYGQQAHPAIFICLLLVVFVTGWAILSSANKKQLLTALVVGHIATTALLLIPLTTPSSVLENRYGKLVITQKNTSDLTITDSGYLAGLQSPEKNIQFQVKRHLMQCHGTLKIAHLELEKLNGRALRAVNELMTVVQIAKITLPQINPTDSSISAPTKPRTPFFWRQLSMLRTKARNKGTFINYRRNADFTNNIRS